MSRYIHIGYPLKKLHKANPYCVWCGRMTYLDKWHADPNIYASREHLFPRHAGGSNHPSNIAIACRQCNKSRGASLGPPPHLKRDELLFVPMPEITLLYGEIDMEPLPSWPRDM